MSKTEAAAAFRGWQSLPPHPAENAIGWSGSLFGAPVVAVCYFRKVSASDMLGRISLGWWEQRPADPVVESMYHKVKAILEEALGCAPKIRKGSPSAPIDFRLSATAWWRQSARLTVLSYGLVRDGIPSEHPPLGLVMCDPRNDPMAELFD